MRTRSTTLLLAAVAGLVIVQCAAGSASQSQEQSSASTVNRPQESGNATGTLTVGSSRLVLSHAYAFPQKGYYDPAKEDYRIFVTDRPFPASALKDEFERNELLLERKIQGLEIVVTADRRVVSAQLYHPGLGGTGLAVSGANQFEVTALEAQRIAGKLFMERPLEHAERSVQYEATFSAPIYRRRPITQAELDSAPAKVAGAFLKAAAAGDAQALRAVLTAESVKELDGPEGKEILQLLPVAVSAAMAITSIDVTGDTAVVFAESGSQKIKLTLVRENQQWKVTQPVKP